MCATVCPSQALFFGTREEIVELRPRSTPTNRFQFGAQTVTTKVNMMTPSTGRSEYIDVTAAMNERSAGKQISLNVLMEGMYQEEE